MAWLAIEDRGSEPDSLDVAQGVLTGQRCMRGILRPTENGTVLSRNWQATTIEQFIGAVDSYIRWYNEKRIKISLGSLSPIEYRESLGLTA